MKLSDYKIVVVQPVNGSRLSSEALRKLSDAGILVVVVASHALEGTGDSLAEAILKRLQELERLQTLEQTTRAPEVDKEAAKIVEDAHKRMQPVSSAEHKKFLDDFYGGHD